MSERYSVAISDGESTIVFECDKSGAARIVNIAESAGMEIAVGICPKCNADIFSTDLDINEDFIHDH